MDSFGLKRNKTYEQGYVHIPPLPAEAEPGILA